MTRPFYIRLTLNCATVYHIHIPGFAIMIFCEIYLFWNQRILREVSARSFGCISYVVGMVASVWVHCFKIGRDVPKIFHVSILVISVAIGSQGNIRGFYLLNACQRWG